MKLGALLGPIAAGSKPSALTEQIKAYEDAGFTSLWTAHAVGRGFMSVDPLQVMTLAASHSKALEIGTAILQVPLYNPYELAFRLLSLQQICGDRLSLGVGAGSTQQDFDAFGLNYEDRFTNFADAMKTLREILNTGKSDRGDFSPWPEVLGNTRFLFGTWGKGVEVAARNYAGWIASGMYRTPEQLDAAHQRYKAAGGKRSIVSTIIVDANTDSGELKARLDQYAATGFDDAVIMRLPGAAPAHKIATLCD